MQSVTTENIYFMNNDANMNIEFHADTGIHRTTLRSENRYNYAITIIIEPEKANRIIENIHDLKSFSLDWLRWYIDRNIQHDEDHRNYWTDLLTEIISL